MDDGKRGWKYVGKELVIAALAAGVAVAAFAAFCGCGHQRQARHKTAAALDRCLDENEGDEEKCESLARQNEALQEQHRRRVWDDDEKICRPDGLGNMRCR